MERERINQKTASRIIQQKQNHGTNTIVDNRSYSSLSFSSNPTVQRVSEEDEETMQGKFDSSIQRMEEEDEEPLQGKFESTVQRASEEDEDTLQGKFDKPIQKKNETGMPDNLKAGIESLSGFSMDDVRVHYNSSKPATVQALAYTQGTDIHVAPGQEKHLPHEAWHVAQQMAGRVSPTTIINGMPVNDNVALEHEADVMGDKAVAVQMKESRPFNQSKRVNVFQLQNDTFYYHGDIDKESITVDTLEYWIIRILEDEFDGVDALFVKQDYKWDSFCSLLIEKLQERISLYPKNPQKEEDTIRDKILEIRINKRTEVLIPKINEIVETIGIYNKSVFLQELGQKFYILSMDLDFFDKAYSLLEKDKEGEKVLKEGDFVINIDPKIQETITDLIPEGIKVNQQTINDVRLGGPGNRWKHACTVNDVHIYHCSSGVPGVVKDATTVFFSEMELYAIGSHVDDKSYNILWAKGGQEEFIVGEKWSFHK